MVSESVFLWKDGSKVKRHVSKGKESPRPQNMMKRGIMMTYVVLVATPTVSTIEVSQDVREIRISEHDRWVDAESIDHGRDQRRRLTLWIFAIIFDDDCISILPNFDRSGECLRSESVVVGMLDWAFFRYTLAVPGLWMHLRFSLTC